MAFTRAELDLIEDRWAFIAKGRPCTLSQEDFAILMRWEADGIPSATLVEAIEAFGRRLALRPRRPASPRLAWVGEDLARIQQGKPIRGSRNANAEADPWDQAVKPPLRNLPQAKHAWIKWRALKAIRLHGDAPGYLDHQEAIRDALTELLGHAEALLGPERMEAMRTKVHQELWGCLRGLEGTTRIHLNKAVLAAWNIPE